MRRSIREVEAALRTELCGLCAQKPADGECSLGAQGRCIARARLRVVARVILSVNRGDVFRAIRERLCSTCPRASPDGSCMFTNQATDGMVIEVLLAPPALSSNAVSAGMTPVVEAVERVISQGGRPVLR